MNTILKRVIAMMLCFVLVAGFLPAGAFATENGETGASGATEVTTEPTQAASEDTEASAEVTESDVIAVTGITLDVTALEVGVGELPVTLTATVLPEDATDATVTWTSSEPGVASVDENGVVTFGYMGEAVITAAAGEFTAECAVTVGEGEWAEYAANAVVIAGSDYQQSGTAPKTNATNILNAIKKDYATANGFIFGGDYSQSTNSNSTTTSGINDLKGVVQDVYGTGLNEIYVQGNHDAAVSGLTATGAHDTDAYGVFSINEDDFSSGGYYSSSVASDSMLTALKSYLDAKVAEKYTKPIFVATHLPLHATSRKDNTSASEIFNLLNAAGANGLNIIFLFGHNHSQGYDAYLGNGSIYLKKGDSITVAGGTTSTLNFTYMNYGYVGYVSGSADTTLTMTAFEISDTEVAVKRYDANGLHNLKAEGTTVSGYNTDKNVYGTAVIDLSDGTSTISAIGSDSGDDNTGKDSTVTPEGGDWTTISDGSGKVIYKLDTDGVVDTGVEYLIVAESYAKALSGASSATTAVVDIELDGDYAYTASEDYGWIFTNSGSDYTIQLNGSTYLGRSSTSLTTGNSGSAWTVEHEGSGAYTITQETSSSWVWGSTTYYVRWSNSSGYFQASSSSHNPVRLYKYDRTDTGEAEYAMLNGALTYTVARGADAKAALDAVKAGINVLTSASADGSNPTTLDDGDTDITWTLASDYSGAVPGEYAVTISYKGVQLGVAKVIVPEATIVGYDCDATGAVNKGASKNAETGAYITVKVEDGEDYQVPVTVEMLTDANGNKVSTATVGTITGLFVNYNGQKFPFTLTVNPKAGNNYPSYPDPGAVKVNKTATGIDFQASGVATVELSASGIPMNEGVDVVLVLDTSSSMDTNGPTFTFEDEDGKTVSGKRIALLRPVVNNLIQQFKTKREDGSDPDIDIAIVTFNGNTIKQNTNYIGSAGNRSSTYGIKTGDGTVAGGWEHITKISSTWATDNNNAKTPTSSGTNYDYGLQMAYELLAQKKADSNSERKQFVLFLSDGAPSQYNGVESNDGVAEYENWILANYKDTSEIPSTVQTNKEFYTGYNNNNGQLHRTAEAIKALPGEAATIVTYDSQGVASLKEVEGLGATMYSIGMMLKTNGQRSAEDQEKVLKTIASDDSRFRSVQNVIDLKGVFNTFAQEVLLAATKARFEDQMGEMYDLQLKPITYKPTGSDEDATINPVLEVRSYEIWTRAEYEAGKFSDEDQIGTRKTNADGTYKFETLEVITITSATEATSDQLTDANIIKDGVICGKYVYYNTTDAAVEVDGITVGAETFYWNIGDIKTTELALRYNVYLTNALGENGGRDAGSYATNGDAILYYDNYLGNPCQKEATSPTLAWKGALVNYAFYLVDATTGKPVNNDGIEVPFSNRTVIVNPTFYGNINLNTSEAVESLNIAAKKVIPDGYWLYDESATYGVAVNGNGSGSWTITGDSGLNNPKSTYVTDYHGSDFINDDCDSHEHPDYDFTHTTVWFAVKWEPRAVADTVVIDYGLPVDVHVLTNDMFGKYGKLVGIAKGNVDTAEGDTAQGDFGTAVLDVPETGYTEANSVIRYTLDDMEMKTPDVFTYSVQYANPIVSDNDGFYYGTLTVIPATTIYYEDTFLDLASYTRTDRGAEWTDANLWTQKPDSDATQDEDRPGEVNFAFDTIIDANNVYGYDSAYKNMAEHSLGNAASVHVDANSYATATFTFWGTGFDVISMTSNTTGTLAVQVFNDKNEMVRNTLVDTFYGMEEDGSYVPNAPEAIYQVPVIKIFDLEYGQYTVKITATYNTLMDHTGTENADDSKDGYDLYLDAIRIYDPTGNLDKTANDAYIADGEAYPVYEELRNNIIDASRVTVTENEDGTVTVTGMDLEKGAIFIDCNNEAQIADYVSYGPNNELYLANGQAIAFTVDVTETMADIQLGIKAANGGTVTYKINGDTYTVNTATDMYYSIWEYAKNGGVVVVENVQGGILSLTNIKATFTAQTTTNGLLKMTAEDAGVALMMLRKAPEVEDEVPETTAPEETDPEETVPETTAPEETDPEESVPETTDPEESEPEESVPETKPAKPDNSALKAAVEAARKLKEKDYTKESYKAVKAARNVAEKVLKNKRATQAEIDEALADLNEAMDALESKAPAAKPGKDENKNQNQNASNNGNTNKEEQKVNLIGWIIDVLFGWMFD